MKAVKLSISLPEYMVEELTTMAKKAGVSRSLFLQLILRNYIKREDE